MNQPSTIILDIEIRRAVLNGMAPEDFEEQYPGVEYVRAFHDLPDMGIACVGVQELESGRAHIFCRDNLGDLGQLLERSTRLVTFNGDAFDLALLEHEGLGVPRHKSFDLLAHWRATTGRRVSLAALAEANLGTGKTGNGAMAPIDWQRGLIGKTITYCLADVWLTLELYKLLLAQRWLLNPYNGQRVALEAIAQTSLF